MEKDLNKICTIDGCENTQSSSKKMCHKHYKRLNVHGDPLRLLQADCKNKICLKCNRPARKKLLCNSHYTTEWRENNPVSAHKNIVHSWRRRMAREKGAEGSHTRVEWENKLSEYRDLCAYCKKEAWSDRDHIIPLSKGGTDSIDNIVPACITCNRSKSDSLDKKWTNLLE